MYKSALCHLHSLFSGQASIAGFCYEAAKHNIDVVWLSDHDGRIPGNARNVTIPLVDDFDFRQGPRYIAASSVKTMECFWQVGDVSPCDNLQISSNRDQGHLAMTVQSQDTVWAGASLRPDSAKKSYMRPLLCRPVVELTVDTDITAESTDKRLLIRAHLSQQPPEHTPVVMTYYLGPQPDAANQLPLTLANQHISLDLAAAAEKLGLGLDHTLMALEVRIEASASQAHFAISRFQLDMGVTDPSQLLRDQQSLGEAIAEQYGVVVHASYEASPQEHDMTCFGDRVPLYPHDKELNPSCEAMNAHIESHGGCTSFNHPFSSWKRSPLTAAEREDIVEARAAELIKHRLYGARMIEIGFPEGRNGFSSDQHFRLWDRLNQSKLRIAGIGVSDAHTNVPWEDGNNFANYIASPDCSAANLTKGLKAGNFYMADPVRFRGTIRFKTDQGQTMGGTQTSGRASIQVEQLPPGCTAYWVADGGYQPHPVSGSDFEGEYDLGQVQRFLRFEARDAYGRVILLTNPLWTS